jgi:hypothetical protein
MSTPVFAAVGHPNKGKSSLVATLARDASVRIGPDPGTTREARRYPMQVGGEVLYTLVDTPGFQRARAALAWMRERDTDAGSRPRVVERFVQEHAHAAMFRDECELLRPIVEGAGIIYVVDGAAPYGAEYDAEMEILRWTGRPSMAIINPIGQPRYLDSWQDALGQFFRVVRVLDVLQAPFAQQIDLLRTFGELRESWREPLARAIRALLDDRHRQREDAARAVAELAASALTHRETRDLAKDEDPRHHRAAVEERYRGRLRQLEQRARTDVEAIYGHDGLERRESDMVLLDADLFSQESWLAFGLKRRDLIAVGAIGGAVAGGTVDAALLGHSFLAGTIVGGVVGGALGYLGSDKLADVKVLRQPLGGKRLRCGPTKNLQFPFVLLGRALLHHTVVAGRTHARRDALDVAGESGVVTWTDAEKRELARLFERVRRSDPGTESRAAAVTYLAEMIGRKMDEGAGFPDAPE